VPSLEPIGTIRAFQKKEGAYKLSRLAVLKDYRQYGFGRELVDALHAWVREHAQKAGLQEAKVLSHSQIPVKKFYARFVKRNNMFLMHSFFY
jgi:GNAT superfamily N-acetyltransferase